jgi:tetratricopeptide (TPR) repeat protein
MKRRDRVAVSGRRLVLPTYGVGVPDRNPMFLDRRVYQGSRGAVYPHPVIESVADEARDVAWRALILENRWLRITILPELGGRVYRAEDKAGGRDFVYRNRTIKPALVGLAGPWISGGIEFNWPQHHRPGTFEPVEHAVERHADGSATVWCGAIDRIQRTRALTGFRLRPDRAVLEVHVRLQNRTSEPQTFLWWANPAVAVHDDTQSVFPPDVRAVMDHGKRAVSSFPIATGTYYKVDYSPGTDISRYRNIPVPTSYMAHHSDYDFLGDYDHRAQAGMLHVADHRVVPGKKQWTWGCGAFGRAWDRHLTDADGPYIELMCGAFTDNQPDFSWLMPGEEKSFVQHFLPYRGTGGAKHASADLVLNLDVAAGRAAAAVYASSPRTATVELRRRGRAAPLLRRRVRLSPAAAWRGRIACGNAAPESLTLRVLDGAAGPELLAFTPPPPEAGPMPAPAVAAPPPAGIASVEELFLHGLHLEQYRHATRAPEPYYLEALRRDPLDSRCNHAMGLLLLRRGRFAEAETFFRRAIRRLTMRNPNPADGAPFHDLGLCLCLQGRLDEAFDAFFKASWNAAWQASAFFELARIAARRGDADQALEFAESALGINGRHTRARHLRIALLRRLGRVAEARRAIRTALSEDPLDGGALLELRLVGGPDLFARRLRDNSHARVDLALDYARAGLWREAAALLTEALRPPRDGAPRSAERAACRVHPMALYYRGWVRNLAGDDASARADFEAASRLPPDYCFPNEVECVPALETAQRMNPTDPRAPYYLGLFWYAHRRPDEAIDAWERAARLDPAFPTVHRNLALACFNHRRDPARAWRELSLAVRLDPCDARLLFELDQLARRRNEAPARRLARLRRHPDLVARRDDLSVELAALLNVAGRHDEALAALCGRHFHPWEGGEGKPSSNYGLALTALAMRELSVGRPAGAEARLRRALDWPESLGEGRLPGARENHVHLALGLALRRLGRPAEAVRHLRAAAAGGSGPASAMFYNDEPPDMVFYRGLALRALGRTDEARAVFRSLADYARRHRNEAAEIDYFAVSLPDFLVFEDDRRRRQTVHAEWMAGLGRLGLGDRRGARRAFAAVRRLDAAHPGLILPQAMVDIVGGSGA